MAQASATSSESFPAAPPGLEATAGRAEEKQTEKAELEKEVWKTAAAALEEHASKRLGPGSEAAAVQALRQAVVVDVDQCVKQRTDELWAKGKQMLNQYQQRHAAQMSELQEQVAQFQARGTALEEENARLRQDLAILGTKFAMAGAVFAGSAEAMTAAQTPSVGTATAAALTLVQSPQLLSKASSDTPPLSRTPPKVEAGATTREKQQPLVPEFPNLSGLAPQSVAGQTPTSSAQPLSLAEVLSSPTRIPVSLEATLSSTRVPPAPPPVAEAPQAYKEFSMTLRKADNADLGLNVSHHEKDKILRVEGVRPGGAVEAWNRQCENTDKAVMVGDCILAVNNVSSDPQRMLEECRDQMLLKLTIARGSDSRFGQPMPVLLPAKASPMKPSKNNSALRADASVFVPLTALEESQKEDNSTSDGGSGGMPNPLTDRV